MMSIGPGLSAFFIFINQYKFGMASLSLHQGPQKEIFSFPAGLRVH